MDNLIVKSIYNKLDKLNDGAIDLSEEAIDQTGEAIKEVIYDVAVEQGLTEPDGMNITAEAVQAASAALADAAREFYKEQGMQYDMPKVKIGG